MDQETYAIIEDPKILIVGPTPPPFHGVSVAIKMLLESDLRHRFHLLHLDLADRRGIQHVDKPDLHDVLLFLRQWYRLLTLLLHEQPSVVYLPLSQSTIGFIRDSFFIWPSFFLVGKVIVHLHGGNFRTWYDSCHWVMRAYVRSVLKRLARVIVLGESLKGLFTSLIPFERISAVPNGVHWTLDPAPHHTIPEQRRFRVLYLGNVSRLKGALMLLTSIPLVLKVRQDVEFVFAGPWYDKSEQREAEDLIKREGIADSVRYTGEVGEKEKYALYESADLFIFPGVQQEGQPLVVLEAMAAGLPIIVTDRGCLKETIIDGITGVVVPPGCPQAIADKVIQLMHQPKLRLEMGRRAHSRFEEEYTLERFAGRMQQVFEAVLISRNI